MHKIIAISSTSSTSLTMNAIAQGSPESVAQELLGDAFIGVRQWQELFGLEAICLAHVPKLPSNIALILTSRCPVYPAENNRVYDTHLLFLMPVKLNGITLTIMQWQKILETKIANSAYTEADFLFFFDNYETETFADKGVDEARWVLMLKTVLPGSTNKTIDQQMAYFSEYQSKKIRTKDYWVLSMIEVVTGIFLYYLRTGKRLYGEIDSLSNISWLKARTSDKSFKGKSIHAGHFDSNGLFIDDFGLPCRDIGLAVGALSN